MLLLAIIATIICGLSAIGALNRGFQMMRESDDPGITFIGVLIGIAIDAFPIIAVWVLYCHL